MTASCPVPIVMASGKKLPEIEVLTIASNAPTAVVRQPWTWAATFFRPKPWRNDAGNS